MTVFYRYLRPVEYSFTRNTIMTSPRGGVCFRVEVTNDNTLVVAYSICHVNDVFSRETARKIADTRAGYNHSYEIGVPTSLDTDAIAKSMIKRYDNLQFVYDEGAPRHMYMDYDLQLLRQRILEIWATHRAAESLNLMDREVIDALNLRKFYEAATR